MAEVLKRRIKKVTKAIFPVAGLGTRFLPATKSIPKEILTLVDRPLIQYAIDEARAAGIKEFIFVTSRGKSALEDYFDHSPELEATLRRAGKDALLEILRETNMDSGAIAYVRQNRPLGLGHAVWCARRLIGDEPFAVLLPDDVIAADICVIGHHVCDRDHVVYDRDQIVLDMADLAVDRSAFILNTSEPGGGEGPIVVDPCVDVCDDSFHAIVDLALNHLDAVLSLVHPDDQGLLARDRFIHS
jgi:hypothetical protein